MRQYLTQADIREGKYACAEDANAQGQFEETAKGRCAQGQFEETAKGRCAQGQFEETAKGRWVLMATDGGIVKRRFGL